MTKLTSSQQGKLSELIVMTKLASLGWIVSVPFSDASVYDLVSESSIGLVRLQVKTCRMDSKPSMGRSALELKTKPSNKKAKPYDKSDVDFIAGVYQDKIYIVPVTDSLPKDKLYFSDKPNFRYSKVSCDIDNHPLFKRVETV